MRITCCDLDMSETYYEISKSFYLNRRAIYHKICSKKYKWHYFLHVPKSSILIWHKKESNTETWPNKKEWTHLLHIGIWLTDIVFIYIPISYVWTRRSIWLELKSDLFSQGTYHFWWTDFPWILFISSTQILHSMCAQSKNVDSNGPKVSDKH